MESDTPWTKTRPAASRGMQATESNPAENIVCGGPVGESVVVDRGDTGDKRTADSTRVFVGYEYNPITTNTQYKTLSTRKPPLLQ